MYVVPGPPYLVHQGSNLYLLGVEGDVWMAIRKFDYGQLFDDEDQDKFVLGSIAEMWSFYYSQAGESRQDFLTRCCRPDDEYFVFGPFRSKEAVEQDLTSQLSGLGSATLPIFGGQWVTLSKTQES